MPAQDSEIAGWVDKDPYQAAAKRFRSIVAKCTRITPEGSPFVLSHTVIQLLQQPNFQLGRTVLDILWPSAVPDTKLNVERKTRFSVVFCILFETNSCNSLPAFYDLDIDDETLPVSQEILLQCFLKEMIWTKNHDMARTHSLSFYRAQFRWKPLTIDYNFSQSLCETSILPICSEEQMKPEREFEHYEFEGGATIWHVQVPQEYVSQRIQEDMPQARRIITSGRCGVSTDTVFEFALKRYSQDGLAQFNNECFIHRNIGIVDGIIKCVGWFEKSSARPAALATKTYNILLELGGNDFHKALSNADNSGNLEDPRSYWASFSTIPRGLAVLLRFGGNGVTYQGWHGDVKPENMICFRYPYKHYKLTDFADAVIKVSDTSTAEARVVLDAYTKTYACPELDDILDQTSPVTQACDVWSLGCVLSVAATALVFGSEGVSTYSKLRTEASKKRTGFPGDIFHDGKQALPEVLEWHKTIRRNTRATDSWTAKVLDVVEGNMLVEAEHRLSASEISSRLQSIVVENMPESPSKT